MTDLQNICASHRLLSHCLQCEFFTVFIWLSVLFLHFCEWLPVIVLCRLARMFLSGLVMSIIFDNCQLCIAVKLQRCIWKSYTLWVKKDQRYYSFITLANVDQFSKFFHIWIQQEICNQTLSGFPPHVNYVATLPCETYNATFIILPLQLLQKLT